MLDSEAFLKNSPYQLSNNITYNLANTTPELLKFQLQENLRNESAYSCSAQPQFIDSSFNDHLRSILHDKSVSIDDELDGDDEFSRDENMSGQSTPSSDVSESWKAVTESRSCSYSNLKVLIENCVFDTSKISPKAVLPLHKVKVLKAQIAEKRELKEYLEEKCTVSNQFCATLLASVGDSDDVLDPSLLFKVLKQTNSLQSELMAVSQELEACELKLKNHNLVCLISGYIEDVRLSNLSTGSSFVQGNQRSQSPEDFENNRAFDTLFSHVASLAAQKNITLPPYHEDSNYESLESKIKWARECIETLTNQEYRPPTAVTDDSTHSSSEDNSVIKEHSFLSASPYKAYKTSTSSERTLSEYKLALDDLKFSQEYFMKEYEYLKENSFKTISEYRKRNNYLEKELSRLLEKTSSGLPGASLESLRAKEKEISNLRKELNLLKIEFMGNKSPRSSAYMSSSLLSNLEGNDAKSPDLSATSSPTFVASSSMSNAILRKEFKKIVSDIQDQYEIELQEERMKRRELEHKMQGLNI